MHIRKFAGLLLLLICLSFPATSAKAFMEISPLDFGDWFIARNDGVYFVRVATNGQITHSPQLIQMAGGSQGIYDLEGLTPGPIVSVTAVVTTPFSLPGSESFTIDTITLAHPPNVNGSGVLRVRMGATARTTGNTNPYGEGDHTGEITITVNF